MNSPTNRLLPITVLLAAAAAAGLILGLGSYTFFYAEGASYFSENPKTCVNCHVMNHQYDTWSRSGHQHVATCNDCHLPKGGIQKYLAKARNGWNHSLAFTLENFHEPIQITQPNREILQENCVRCHQKLVADAILIPAGGSHQAQSCLHCHKNIGHYPL